LGLRVVLRSVVGSGGGGGTYYSVNMSKDGVGVVSSSSSWMLRTEEVEYITMVPSQSLSLLSLPLSNQDASGYEKREEEEEEPYED